MAGTVNPNAKETSYLFEYGETTSYGAETTETSAGSGSVAAPVTAVLSGLDPGTEYHYRVLATTCGGCPAGTHEGTDATFTTDFTPAEADLDGPLAFGSLPQTRVSAPRNLVLRNVGNAGSLDLQVSSIGSGRTLTRISSGSDPRAASARPSLPAPAARSRFIHAEIPWLQVGPSAGDQQRRQRLDAVTGTGTKTGRRARALRRCRSKPTRRARRTCRSRARRLPR